MKAIFLAINMFVAVCFGQNPVSWQFSATKSEEKKFTITMTASVRSPWHIYSQYTPEGGPVATKITFNKNPLVELNNAVKEEGKKITRREEVFDMDVIYFNGNVNFVKEVKLKSKVKTTISGTIEYMVCNDEQCLPPVKVPFTIALQ